MRIMMRFVGARTAASLLAAIALVLWTVPSAASTQSPAAARVHLRTSLKGLGAFQGSGGALVSQPQRVHARVHHSSNPLESIGRQITLPVPEQEAHAAPVPDWSKPIIVGLCILVLFLALRGGVRSRVAALRVRRRGRTPQLRQ